MLGFCSSGRGPRGPAPHLSITARLEAALQQSHLLKVCLVQFSTRATGIAVHLRMYVYICIICFKYTYVYTRV